MGSVQQVPCMVMESVHGVMRRVAGLARAHARAQRARRGDFRTPRGGASSRCGNALRMRRPAGERQCGSLIEPVEGAVDAGEARLPRADDGSQATMLLMMSDYLRFECVAVLGESKSFVYVRLPM